MNNIVGPEIDTYCERHTSQLPPLFDELKEETYKKTTAPQMQVGKLEGSFLRMLVAITSAHRILELGTFTGYSSLVMASALPKLGKLITCDIDAKNTKIAQEFWAKTPYGDKIELKIGPAIETMNSLLYQSFDLVFIDADKANYINYWDNAVPLVRQGGLIVVDNVLWSGRVLDPQEKSDFHIVEFNEHALKDDRVEVVMLPVRDGLLLARVL